MSEGDRIERAQVLYEHAVFGGDRGALASADRELDAVEADLALARGRILHARFLAGSQEGAEEDPQELALFERAVDLFHTVGDERGESEALFWVGCLHQGVRGEGSTGLPFFEQSYALATSVGDTLTASYAVRHLAFEDLAAGRLDGAQARFDESVRLREELGFLPGVAARKLALAELAGERGDRDAAVALLDEASSIAEDSGSHGILRWIEQARAELR